MVMVGARALREGGGEGGREEYVVREKGTWQNEEEGGRKGREGGREGGKDNKVRRGLTKEGEQTLQESELSRKEGREGGREGGRENVPQGLSVGRVRSGLA